MAKKLMIVSLDYDDDAMHGDDSGAIEWFEKNVLQGRLRLKADEIDDEVDQIQVMKAIPARAFDDLVERDLERKGIIDSALCGRISYLENELKKLQDEHQKLKEKYGEA